MCQDKELLKLFALGVIMGAVGYRLMIWEIKGLREAIEQIRGKR